MYNQLQNVFRHWVDCRSIYLHTTCIGVETLTHDVCIRELTNVRGVKLVVRNHRLLTTLAIHMPHFKITIKNHPHPHGHKTFKYSYKTVQSEYCMYWI